MALVKHRLTFMPCWLRFWVSLLLVHNVCALTVESAAPGSPLTADLGCLLLVITQNRWVSRLSRWTGYASWQLAYGSDGCIQPALNDLLSQHWLAELVLKCVCWQLSYILYERCVSSWEFNVREETGLLEPHLFLTTGKKNLLGVEKAEPGLQGRTSL